MPYVGRTPSAVPVTADDIPANSIDASKIVDGSIELAEIADNSITDAKLNSSKLDNIEASADVTDTTNVTSSGALMDSEVTNLAQVKAFDTTDYATSTQGTTADNALPKAGGTITGDLAIDGDTTLAAYNNTAAITGNAVDVFIYDTSNDSDGGAWRKRTQATSWYNETLNTSTRGSRKEFPSVAVIVAEASKVTIYDGDTPDLDMWMVISAGGIIDWATSTQTRIAVSALNGIVTTACGDGGHLFRFIDDTTYILYNSLSYNVTSDRSIANRNGATTYTSTGGVVNTYRVIHYAMNDVAMTVLPNAPIDSATGLPIPTIAVATDAGVSVIKDDGNVWDITSASSVSNGVVLDGNNLICNLEDTTDNYAYVYVFNQLPTADNALTINTKIGSTLNAYAFYKGGKDPSYYDLRILLNTLNTVGGFRQVLSTLENSYAIATYEGLSLLKENTTTPTKGSVAYLTSTYNSGYMTGDIKGAWLADTDTTNVVGSGELVTNGTFDTDTSWTKGAGWTISGGTAVATNVASGVEIVQTITLPVDGYYIISVNVLTANSTYSIGGSGYGSGSLSGTGIKQLTTGFLTAGTRTVYIGAWSSGLTGTFDNVSVKLADADRSVNNNGLQVNGTITKTAVATGAELVGYSGFSGANYLEQPYNADLDFGTGDFSISFWIKHTNAGGSSILRRWDGTGFTDVNGLYLNLNVNGSISMYIANVPATVGAATYNDGTWHSYTFARIGAACSQYKDGVLDVTGTSSVNITAADNDDAPIRIGGTATFVNGSLALWRFSATAPTAAQILEIYNAEKPLFQENAKCTLNGASDAVQCLAYDDSTELLHVGTSGGRSTFQGLRRVDETSTNTTEISAQGGMIIEETA